MVGLAIVAILGGLAVPSVNTLVRDYNLRSAADDLVFAANFARGQAASNRRAYGLILPPAGTPAGLTFSVRAGTTAACASVAGGTEVLASNYAAGNPLGKDVVVVTARAPAETSNQAAFVCFRPDGRVVRGDNLRAFSAPAGGTLFSGDVILELQRWGGTGVIGTPLQVQISYNGTARITYGRPLGELQGSGNGGGSE